MKLATVRAVLRWVARQVRDRLPLSVRQELVAHFAERMKVRVEFPDSGAAGRE